MNYWLLIIFGVAGLLAIGAVFVLIYFKPKKIGLKQQDFAKYWQKIDKLIGSNNLAESKQAVMEADKLLDMVLKSRVNGENLGSRLKVARSIFRDKKNYNLAWEAHKLRNKIAHEVDFDPGRDLCYRTVGDFKKVFRDLGYVI